MGTRSSGRMGGRRCDLALWLFPWLFLLASLFSGWGDSLCWAASILGRGWGLLASWPGASSAPPGVGSVSLALTRPPGAEYILGPRD